MAKSVEKDGWFGKYTEHYDDDGNKVGESRERDGFFGTYTEHTDSSGNKTGESREKDGFFGSYTKHTDSRGEKVGESRERDGFFGDYVEHTDRKGTKIGESREREGLFERYTEHTGSTPYARSTRRGERSDSKSASGEDEKYDSTSSASYDSASSESPGAGFWLLLIGVIVIGALMYGESSKQPAPVKRQLPVDAAPAPAAAAPQPRDAAPTWPKLRNPLNEPEVQGAFDEIWGRGGSRGNKRGPSSEIYNRRSNDRQEQPRSQGSIPPVAALRQSPKQVCSNCGSVLNITQEKVGGGLFSAQKIFTVEAQMDDGRMDSFKLAYRPVVRVGERFTVTLNNGYVLCPHPSEPRRPTSRCR